MLNLVSPPRITHYLLMKKIKHIPFCLYACIHCVLLLTTQIILSQSQIAFSHLSIEDGLSQNSVISMAQDSIGYMWFATQDGLNRYDGYSFKTYDKQFEDITRPTFSRLGKIYFDKQNRLWIITNSGKLELYDAKQDNFKPIDAFNAVSTVFQDESLNMYVGTYGKGLFKINATTKDTIQLLNSNDLSRTINGFFQLKSGLLVATSGAVFRFDDTKYSNLTSENNNINFSTIAQSKNGTLWVGSYGNGLFHNKNDASLIMPYINKDVPNNLNIEDLLIDKDERLWIATYGKGAFLLDFNLNKTVNFLENKTNPFAVHYNDMLCLYQDNTGIVWLGSDGAGLSYYDKHLIKFNVLTNKQMPISVDIDVVRSISTDENENMWIGTSGKGLTYIDIDQNLYKTYTSSNSDLASNRIISLCHSNKALWIGHQGFGLNILEPSGKYRYFPELSKYVIWRIVSVSSNRSWLCTENNGLILFDKNEGIIKSYHTDNSKLLTNNIKTMVFGDNDEVWIGTENNGVYKLDQKTKEISKIENLLDPIKSLFFKDDMLWVGTSGNGLKLYNSKTGKLHNYTTAHGLPNNVIYGILPDDDGNLWLSSNIGLTKFKIINEGENVLIENYNNYDGLQALEFNTGAYYKSPNGFLYFGGLDGINWFHPSQLTLNTVKPKTVINNLALFNKPIEIDENKKFKHNQNTITFTFTSLHFSQPERNQFKYRLINNDEDWIHSGNTHTAHYTNLPPNDYEFQVISSNYDGFWNTVPATFKFKILKPWYLTNAFKLAYLLLILITALAIYKYLKWRWEIKAQLQIEHTETERLKQLDELKTKLYANVSHEFRTPLTLILDPIENQLSKKNISQKDRTEFTLVQRNAKRLLNLVSQLMDLSKLEAGSLKLHVSKNDLSPFIKQLVSSFKYNIDKKKIDFSHNIANIKEVWFDKDAVEKIVTNLLSNAVKYTPKHGRIIFDVNKQKDHAIITILNNGSTINPKDIDKLFNRYYRGDSNQEGTGIGLALVKELVTLSKGSIVANVINTDDIQFTITLPITKEAFNIEDIIETPRIVKSPKKNPEIKHKQFDKKPLILVVEDDKDIRNYLKSCLEDTYKIITAANGKTGINKALKNIPDLIVSDVMMPLVNGIELCNTLKSNELTSHIPIILLTAKGDDESELEGLNAKADDYMTKPFKSRILETRIANLIALRKALRSRYNQEIIHKAKDIAITSLDETFLNKVEDVFKDNLTDSNFDAEAFSKKMLMSRMQLHRKLKALTGLSTTEFLRSQRLKIAIPLLQQSDATISEIAYQTGFSTPSYFIKCFKKSYHCTPTEYHAKA